MASGVEHNAASAIGAVPLGVGIGLLTYGLGAKLEIALLTGGSAAGGCVAGMLLTPDLDQITLTKSEWVMVKRIPIIGWIWLAIWDLYARAVPHRNILSHLPGLGTLGRLIYLGGVIYPVWLLAGRPALPSPPSLIAISAVLGLSVSDTLHWAMDGGPIRWA